MNEQREMVVLLEGSGKTEQESFANALSGLQKKITSMVEGTVIRIEPMDVEFIEGKEFQRTEKFLFLFWKRQVSQFCIRIQVKVRVFIVDHHAFAFERVNNNGLFKQKEEL